MEKFEIEYLEKGEQKKYYVEVVRDEKEIEEIREIVRKMLELGLYEYKTKKYHVFISNFDRWDFVALEKNLNKVVLFDEDLRYVDFFKALDYEENPYSCYFVVYRTF